jgi:hypothetical protein
MTNAQQIDQFHPGFVYVTPGADDVLMADGHMAEEFLNRHIRCDWGEIPPEDREMNGDGSGYCLSEYRTRTGKRIWIITEWDHSSTTILLPDEY